MKPNSKTFVAMRDQNPPGRAQPIEGPPVGRIGAKCRFMVSLARANFRVHSTIVLRGII
jgi:hypothetical protein